MGFPVRTKGTGNREHTFSQWGLGSREQGTGNKSESAKRDAPQGLQRLNFLGGESLREQGTGNREQGTCRVPQVFPEHVPEPLRENLSLKNSLCEASWFRPQHAGSKPRGTKGTIPLSCLFLRLEGSKASRK